MRKKGIVVEVASRRHIVVLTPQGEFLRVPHREAVSLGQEIDFVESQTPRLLRISFAAVLLLAVIGSAALFGDRVFIPGGMNPTFFVTLDINPSVELAVNRRQRVVAAEGLNTDGERLLSKLHVVGREFKGAIEAIGQQAERVGYLRAGENQVIVTISNGDTRVGDGKSLQEVRVDEHRYSIQHEIETTVVETLTNAYQAHVEIWQVPVHIRDEARQAGVSPGRYVAIFVQHEYAEVEGYERRSTVVNARIESSGNYRVFEFLVTQPVLQPASWARTDAYEMGFPLNTGEKGVFQIRE